MKKILLSVLLISNLINAQVLETFPNPTAVLEPSNFINFNNKMFYFARDASYQFSLYATDGTSVNNNVIKNLGFAFSSNLNNENTFNDYKIIYNDKLYFNFSNILYQSDGTTNGTIAFKPALQNSRFFKIFNNKLYFIAYSANSGVEVWSTDGTEAGTILLKDINPGANNAFNYQLYNPHFTVFNNKLFFVANDGVHGYELWSTDGTEAGTALFKDIRTNEGGNTTGFGAFLTGTYSNPNFAVVGNKMYFGANPHIILANSWKTDYPLLYETDGTVDGTFIVQPTSTGDFNYFNDIRGLTAINNKLFFFGSQVFHNFGGVQNRGIYVIDGTNPVTRIEGFELLAGDAGTSDEIQRYSMRPYNGDYYFLGKLYDNTDVVNLWKMNPSDYTFTKITQTNSGRYTEFAESGLQLLVAKEFKNRLFFVKTKYYDGKIFSTNGSEEDTKFEAKSTKSNSTQALTSIPWTIFDFNDALYFKGQFALGQPNALWRLNFSTLSTNNFSVFENNFYPNPTNGIVKITSSDNLKSLLVFNLLGKQIISQNLNKNEANIDLTELNSGIYFVKIESENGNIETKKIIKN